MAIDSAELQIQVIEHLENLGMILNGEGKIALPEMTKDFVRKLPPHYLR